ncbi:hypothetical protein SAMN06265367_10484 [Algoriphagus winogradskyi]|uniref:Uncharacterized protein n=1 Tax=Algoriphagus winogradskyi TaxID=237017 RepID=A0ABY1P362_9BACT|nr:hypothetical protein SAMN06265367_10484 [Algoriphagus winogradskyi]
MCAIGGNLLIPFSINSKTFEVPKTPKVKKYEIAPLRHGERFTKREILPPMQVTPSILLILSPNKKG